MLVQSRIKFPPFLFAPFLLRFHFSNFCLFQNHSFDFLNGFCATLLSAATNRQPQSEKSVDSFICACPAYASRHWADLRWTRAKKVTVVILFHLPPKVKAKAAKKTMELGKGLWGVPGFLPIPRCGISLNLFFLGRYKNNCTQNVARQRDTKCTWPFVCSFFYYSIMHYQEYRVGLCPYRH